MRNPLRAWLVHLWLPGRAQGLTWVLGLVLSLVMLSSLSIATPARAQTLAPVSPSDRVLGRADAPVTVIEYASFSCPGCAAWHRDIFPAFKARFIDTGRVRLVFRNLPTAPAREAFAAAAIARCARPERFFDVARSLFQGQELLLSGASAPWFANAIGESGRTRAEISACFEDPATQAAVNADVQSAAAAGVASTPSFFVNGQAVREPTLARLSAAIAAASPEN